MVTKLVNIVNTVLTKVGIRKAIKFDIQNISKSAKAIDAFEFPGITLPTAEPTESPSSLSSNAPSLLGSTARMFSRKVEMSPVEESDTNNNKPEGMGHYPSPVYTPELLVRRSTKHQKPAAIKEPSSNAPENDGATQPQHGGL